MINLLKVEFYKLKRFQFGHIVLLFMLVCGFTYGNFMLGKLDSTTTVFSYVVSDTSFVFLMSLVAALFIGKDFSNRTICNEVKLGYRRFHILLSRMIAAVALVLLLHAAFVISTVLGFSVKRGFDTSILSAENAFWLLVVCIQLTAVLSGVVLISFMARNVSTAIALSVIYAFVCCNVLRNFMSSNSIFTLSCFYFVQDKGTENLVFAAISAFVTMAVFLMASVFAFNKAEIK